MGRPRSDIGPRIVHAARARFLAEGVDGASLRTIAADAKTSIGMVYYYFPTKDDLFLAVVEEVYGVLLHDVDEAMSIEAPIDERLRRASARLGRVTDVELAVVRLVVREALVSSSRLDRLFARFMRGHIPLLMRTLVEGVAAGTIEPNLPLPVLLVASMAMVALPPILRRSVGDRAPALVELPEGEALASQLVDVLMHGISRRPTRTRRGASAAELEHAKSPAPKRLSRARTNPRKKKA